MLARVLARDAGVEPGRTVVLCVHGPIAFTDAIRIETGDDGRPRGVLVDDGAEVDPDGPDVRVVLDTESFMRRAAGRWPVAATPATTTGDGDLGRRVLEALAVTP